MESRRMYDSLVIVAPMQGAFRRAVGKAAVTLSPGEWIAVNPGTFLEPDAAQEYPVTFRSLTVTPAALKAFFNEAGLAWGKGPSFPDAPFRSSQTLVRTLADLEEAMRPSTALGASKQHATSDKKRIRHHEAAHNPHGLSVVLSYGRCTCGAGG
jgi:hypothetical protein